MMHGTKKSDPSIVPTKPANKAEQSAAESVEERGGTKRNAELQSTVRTQCREAVSQAQARIREARVRRITLVALARKLIVALWRYLQNGIVPEGAVLKAA